MEGLREWPGKSFKSHFDGALHDAHIWNIALDTLH